MQVAAMAYLQRCRRLGPEILISRVLARACPDSCPHALFAQERRHAPPGLLVLSRAVQGRSPEAEAAVRGSAARTPEQPLPPPPRLGRLRLRLGRCGLVLVRVADVLERSRGETRLARGARLRTSGARGLGGSRLRKRGTGHGARWLRLGALGLGLGAWSLVPRLTTTEWLEWSSLRSRLSPPAAAKASAKPPCCAAFCTSAAA